MKIDKVDKIIRVGYKVVNQKTENRNESQCRDMLPSPNLGHLSTLYGSTVDPK
jgi:hypothetical protein